MAISSARAYYGLQGVFNLSSKATTGQAVVGPAQTAVNLPTTGDIWAVEIEVDSGGTVEIDIETLAVTVSGAGAAQVETATAAGTIGTSGNATVVVTGDDIAGSPLTVSVAVTSGDSAATWAGKVRTALGAVTAITDKYTVGGNSTSISLTRIVRRYNDATLNISLANGTCTGITAAPNSSTTTTGANPSSCVRLDGVTFAGDDAEGKELEDSFENGCYGLLIYCENIGTGIIVTDGDGNVSSFNPGQVDEKISPNNPLDISNELTFSDVSGGYGKATIVVVRA
jgi:hypothetical protein